MGGLEKPYTKKLNNSHRGLGHGSASCRTNIFPPGKFTEQKNSVWNADGPLPVHNSISRDGGRSL